MTSVLVTLALIFGAMLGLAHLAMSSEQKRRALDRADFRRLGLPRSGEGRIAQCIVEISEYQVHVRPPHPMPRTLTIERFNGFTRNWLSGDRSFDSVIDCCGPQAWLRARMNAPLRAHVIRIFLKWPARYLQGNLSIDYFGGSRPHGEHLEELVRDAVDLIEALAAPFDEQDMITAIAISDPIVNVRRHAIAELTVLLPPGSASLEDALRRSLHDPDTELRLFSAERLGSKAAEALVALFSTAPEIEQRARALVALAAFFPHHELTALLSDPELADRFNLGRDRMKIAREIVRELVQRENGRLSLVSPNGGGLAIATGGQGSLSAPDRNELDDSDA